MSIRRGTGGVTIEAPVSQVQQHISMDPVIFQRVNEIQEMVQSLQSQDPGVWLGRFVIVRKKQCIIFLIVN